MKVNIVDKEKLVLKCGHLYEFEYGYSATFLGIYLENSDGEQFVVDLEDNCIYQDIENYTAKKELDFEINVLGAIG